MINLESNPIIYITRDIERALGLELNTSGYYIISNSTPFAKFIQSEAEGSVADGHDNVLLIEDKELLDTWELLKHPNVIKKINSLKNVPSPLQGEGQGEVNIIVFKNTKQIERTCAENGWNLLNPPAELSDKIEEKISQLDWLGDLKKYLPDYTVGVCKNVKWNNEPFILQFNRSHTGSGTFLIENEDQLKDLQTKFPDRPTRTAKYIDGPLFTNNNIVAKDKILMGNISYQITGLKPFTDKPFATIGNDWALPHKYLNNKQLDKYKNIVEDIGKKLQADGWKGLFGVDIVVDDKSGELYLVEINARQPASTTYESQLQANMRTMKDYESTSAHRIGGNYEKITTFEAHLLALLGDDLTNKEIIPIKDGAQVISRNTYHVTHITDEQIEKLKKLNLNLIQYNNIQPNSDLLRIQSKNGIMQNHNEFNPFGKNIVNNIAM